MSVRRFYLYPVIVKGGMGLAKKPEKSIENIRRLSPPSVLSNIESTPQNLVAFFGQIVKDLAEGY